MNTKRERLYEFIFCLLAILSVILAILDINNMLTPVLSYVDYTIWIIFVIDYLIRFIFAKGKLGYIKSNVFDLIAILPFNSAFRAFRALKLFKLLKLTKLSKTFRMMAVLGRFSHKFMSFLNTNGFKYMLLIATLFTFIGGSLISVFENISLADGIWWAFVTTTTVGYGDISPDSNIGRIIACILMIVGIGLVGSLTSTITSYFMHNSSPDQQFSNNSFQQIKELKELLDIGAITQEEFDLKKKKLLDL